MAFTAKNTPEDTRLVCAAVSKEVLAPVEKADGTMSEPQISVVLRVLEGEHEGKDLFWTGHMTEKAQERTLETLRNMGWTGDDLFSDEGLGSVKVYAVAYHDEYKGKTRLKWYINPIKSKRATLEPDAAKAFARQFKALAKGIPSIRVTDENRAGVIPPARTGKNAAAVDATDGTEF